MTCSNFSALNSDVFRRILHFLNFRDVCKLATLNQQLNTAIEGENCKTLWEEASKSKGISACLPGKSWKQTFCLLTQRWEKVQYVQLHVDIESLPQLKESRLCYDSKQNMFSSAPSMEKQLSVYLNKASQMAKWCDAEGVSLVQSPQPKGYEVKALALNGDHLAIHYAKFNTFSPWPSILHIWDLEEKKRIFEYKTGAPITDLQIDELKVVLALDASWWTGKPSPYGIIFNFWHSSDTNEKSAAKSG